MKQLVGEPPEPDDELLTLYQVAELLYAHPETVNQWLRRGQLRGVRVGDGKRGWRIWASDFRCDFDKSSNSGKGDGCEAMSQLTPEEENQR
jgi:excisionase family DNA binding protein